MADYKIPVEPVNGFTMPFADEGQRTVIANAAPPGRATLPGGFPAETQLPLSQGGIAPNRLDFNGAFNMLSAFAFWQQSGGLYTYKADYNYTPPAVIMHGGVLWWCAAQNGPATEAGRKEPGTSEEHWILFVNQLLLGDGSGDIRSLFGSPVGTVITYASTVAPGGYLACDGENFSVTEYPQLFAVLGVSRTPDMRGLFVRGYDPDAVNDPEGGSRGLLSRQGDAIRNITGRFFSQFASAFSSTTSGVFTALFSGFADSTTDWKGRGSNYSLRDTIDMDFSHLVPTAPENRPKNINLLYCIKHD